MPHPGLTQYMKINTKYFDQGVTVVLTSSEQEVTFLSRLYIVEGEWCVFIVYSPCPFTGAGH